MSERLDETLNGGGGGLEERAALTRGDGDRRHVQRFRDYNDGLADGDGGERDV